MSEPPVPSLARMAATPAEKAAHLIRTRQRVYRVLTNLVAAMASSVGGPMEAVDIIEKEVKVLRGDLEKAVARAARKQHRKGK